MDEGTQRIQASDLQGRKLQLNIVEGVDQGNQLEVTKALTLIGRARRNDIILQDKKVSATHASIEIRGGEAILKDLGSTNGTFVNNQQVSAKVLSNMDEIIVGTTKILVSIFDDLSRFKQSRIGKHNSISQSRDSLLHEDSANSQIISEVPPSNSPTANRLSQSSAHISQPPPADPPDPPGESTSFLNINKMISEEVKGLSGFQSVSKTIDAHDDAAKTAALSNVACTLRLIAGPDQPKDFTLRKATSILGRKDCEIKLNDIDVSRKHALIEFLPPDKLLIRDLGSTNGTFVNAQRITQQVLKNKDIVQIGQTLIEVFMEKIEKR